MGCTVSRVTSYVQILLRMHRQKTVTATEMHFAELLWMNLVPYLWMQTFHINADVTTSKMASQGIQGKIC